MVLTGRSELAEAAGAAVCVGVAVAAAAEVVAPADTDVEVMGVDVDEELEVPVVVDDNDVDSVESSLNWPSLALASSQPFCLASYMQSTSSWFPPAITTVLSDP